jgi:two-component system, chemotaxis family, protein-glutamate methylesterase/glutaminase
MSSSETKGRRPLPGVMIVEDSALLRGVMRRLLEESGEHRVVAEAETGYEAIRLVHATDPDIVTLDLELPDLSGLDALGYIMSEAPRPVVIVSAYLESIEADALPRGEDGAIGMVAKPAGSAPAELGVFRGRLLSALRAARQARLERRVRRAADAVVQRGGAFAAGSAARPERALCAVAIGASTGGPRALLEIIPRLPAGLPAAVFIVQHMPPPFTRYLADRLDAISALPVVEAQHGDVVRTGTVMVAPGGYHLSFERGDYDVRVALEVSDPVAGLRPSADVLFGAVARHFGPRSLGIVLTGMGRDGADGLRAVQQVGGWTAVQDEQTAVIASMPRAAAPFAGAFIPLDRIAAAIVKQATKFDAARSA